jgi:heme/copper-type cytochrome/quinol oxidase subunit 2
MGLLQDGIGSLTGLFGGLVSPLTGANTQTTQTTESKPVEQKGSNTMIIVIVVVVVIALAAVTIWYFKSKKKAE